MNNDLVLFFDGCHKIYYAHGDDCATIDQMISYGYEAIVGNFSKNLAELWRKSCGLRFVEPADFDSKKPRVEQFKVGGLRGFRTILSNYYKGIN